MMSSVPCIDINNFRFTKTSINETHINVNNRTQIYLKSLTFCTHINLISEIWADMRYYYPKLFHCCIALYNLIKIKRVRSHCYMDVNDTGRATWLCWHHNNLVHNLWQSEYQSQSTK